MGVESVSMWVEKGLFLDALMPLVSFRSMSSETYLGILPYSLEGCGNVYCMKTERETYRGETFSLSMSNGRCTD